MGWLVEYITFALFFLMIFYPAQLVWFGDRISTPWEAAFLILAGVVANELGQMCRRYYKQNKGSR